ncbi:ATP-dependent Clp protease ATP-binding protein [Candidatus Magnetomorum sp. HK-1]|nr:ATP-dependent Clp protease ATP-binding protein [Candidatus Magnetomorum sp. HK-1]
MEFIFSNHLQQIIDSAISLAKRDGTNFTEYHLLYVLIRVFPESVPPGKMSAWLNALEKKRSTLKRVKHNEKPPYDKLIKIAFKIADQLRIKNRSPIIMPEHLLEVLIGPKKPLIDMEKLIQEQEEPTTQDEEWQKENEELPESSILSRICVNFTQKAKLGQFDQVVGREKEIQEVIRVLLKRKKNNPILLGEAGVGKTAIIEGIAQELISSDDNPLFRNLKDREILGLDLMSLIGGTSLRGELEKRLNELISELEKKAHKYILFIDEVHNLIGAGKSEGSADLANYLKPALARGELSIIGATTLSEYKRFIEPDAALKRRMEQVIIREHTIEETTQILKAMKSPNEEFHNVEYEDGVIEKIPVWAANYFSETRLPDSALNFLDNLGAYAAQKNEKPDIIAKVTADMAADFIQQSKEVDRESILLEANQRITDLKQNLEPLFLGQKQALQSLYKQLSMWGIPGYPRKRIFPLLFWGAMGATKIDCAYGLAEYLYPIPNKIFHVDLASYSDRESLYTLIGPPRGIEGYQDGGELTEFVKRNPQCCLILSNMEHCHPNVMRIFLEPLRQGIITDNARISYPFHQAMMIVTTDSLENAIQMHGKEIFDIIPNTIEFVQSDDNFTNILFDGVIQDSFDLFEQIGFQLSMEQSTKEWLKQTVFQAMDISSLSRNTMQHAIKSLFEDNLTTYIIENQLPYGTIQISNTDKLIFSNNIR